jgi:hypothetical protein
MRILNPVFAIAVTLVYAPSTHAGLLFEGTALASGGGFGGNTTLLTIQGSDPERGCIRWDGVGRVLGSSACVVTNVPPVSPGVSSVGGGNESSGSNQSRVRSIADTGALNANQIRFVFNANEGGGSNSTIRLDDLIITFFDPAGNLVWHSGQSAVQPNWVPVTYDDPTGTGTSGQVFRLFFEDVAAVQAAVFNQPDFLNYRVGAQMAASLSGSGGDNLFVTNNTALGFPEVLEPATFGYLAIGLALLAAARRYQIRSNAM